MTTKREQRGLKTYVHLRIYVDGQWACTLMARAEHADTIEQYLNHTEPDADDATRPAAESKA